MNESIIRRRKYSNVLVLAVLIFGSFACAQETDCGTDESSKRLNHLHKALDEFKASCGRFPLSSEGVIALITVPPKLKCRPKIGDLEKVKALDYWSKPYKYSSDGKHYRVDSSYGYFVTDTSQKNKRDGKYWQNPHPRKDHPSCALDYFQE